MQLKKVLVLFNQKLLKITDCYLQEVYRGLYIQPLLAEKIKKTITTMTVGRKEDILNNEIEPWKSFEYALREENSSLFNKMIAQCQDNNEYSNAAEDRGE
ncbi:MAG TPA: hypothetical protein VJ250_08895 [Nitrososphaeraceae archaeon]|nr:hypothetical protein [Nitrososphaeraceae archaeon]